MLRGHICAVVLHLFTKFCANIFIHYTKILAFTKFNMTAVCRLALVQGSRGITHEGPFMMAVLCKKNCVMIRLALLKL